MRYPRSIRDPIYGYVEVPAEYDGVLDHPLYQRLRRVGQMSLTSHVFPGATGSRFEHGLGAMHLARRAWRAAWRNATPDAREAFESAFATVEFDRDEYDTGQAAELIVAGAALLHDLGHPPFSHILEPYCAHRFPVAGDRAYHEQVGLELTPKVLAAAPPWLRDPVHDVLVAKEDVGTWDGALHAIVAGEVDIDRLDYLMRDADRTGTEFGAIDYAKLLDSYLLYVRDERLAVAPHVRARRAVESLLIQRVQAYRWVAHHPRAIASSIALQRSLQQLDMLANDVTPLEGHDARTLADVFAPLAPAMDLLDPARNLPDLVPHLAEGYAADEETLLQIQAGIDDATVIEALKRAIVAARLLEHAGHAPESVQLLRVYAETALNRARGSITAWKTTDAFRVTAAGMVRSLVDLFHGRPKALVEVVDQQAAAAPARFVNWMIRELLTDDERIRQFDDAIAEQVPHALAVEIHRLHFKPVNESKDAARLHDPDQRKDVRVVDTSELARALSRVPAESPPLRLYAFTDPDLARAHGPAIVEALRARFGMEFVHHASETLPAYLDARAPADVIRSLLGS